MDIVEPEFPTKYDVRQSPMITFTQLQSKRSRTFTTLLFVYDAPNRPMPVGAIGIEKTSSS